MNAKGQKFLKPFSITLILLLGISISAFAQPGSSDIQGGSTVFVLRPPRKFFKTDRSVRQTAPQNKTSAKSSSAAGKKSSGKSGGGQKNAAVEIEPDAPEDWINEQADNAIEERKFSDSEPFLSLPAGYLNSRANFCETPQFPPAARKAGQKLVTSKMLVTVGQYGGILHAAALEGDASFRAAVYNSLGSMSFRQSFFMGKPVRVEGVLNFTQNPGNTVLCREAAQELEVPAVIDGGVLNGFAKACEMPQFPADAKSAGLTKVEAKIQIVVDEQGNVIAANPIADGGSSGHPSFTDAAVKSALKMTFPKSLITGKPVKVRGIIEFTQSSDNAARCAAAN